MKFLYLAFSLILSFSLTSCGSDSPSNQNQPNALPLPTAPAAAAPTPEASASDPLSFLKKGMAYANVREALLAQGWKPLPDPECRANVIGGDYETSCARHPEWCQICSELPELSACSNDPYCLMRFRQSNQILEIATYGDISDWKTRGKNPTVGVTHWEILPQSSQ
jgi:hypothetical protein